MSIYIYIYICMYAYGLGIFKFPRGYGAQVSDEKAESVSIRASKTDLKFEYTDGVTTRRAFWGLMAL